MGLLALQQGENVVITSDRKAGDVRTSRPPKGKPTDTYEVWTGSGWSAETTAAKAFGTLDLADEYIRANFGQLTD